MKIVFYNKRKSSIHHKTGTTLVHGENRVSDNAADQLVKAGLVTLVNKTVKKVKKSVKEYEDKSMVGKPTLDIKDNK